MVRVLAITFLLILLALGTVGGCGGNDDMDVVDDTPGDTTNPPDPPGEPTNPPDDGDTNDTEPIGIDDVVELTDGFGLVDTNTDLRLKDPSNGSMITELAGSHAVLFEELSRVADCPLCLIGFDTYKNHINARFWYQTSLGTIPNSDYNDGTFSGDDAIRLHAAVTLMSWALSERMNELLSCAVSNARSLIPERYNVPFSLVSQLDAAKLREDFLLAFFPAEPSTTHISIGAFDNDASNGAITLGVTWSRPLDSRPQEAQDLSNIQNLDSVLIGINQNVSTDADKILTLGRSAGNIFHELLHNFGFGHNTNDLSSYKDRTIAILAIEDCMCNLVRDRVIEGNLDGLTPGTLWLQPMNLGPELPCRDSQ